MPLQFKLAVIDRIATLFVSGKFTFVGHVEFRSAIDGLDVDKLIIDLAQTQYMDSSALGMLLIAKDLLAPAQIVIHKAYGEVSASLRIANFQKVFTIE
jgi:anti-anti-sigma factor